jgi:hypothetical protein
MKRSYEIWAYRFSEATGNPLLGDERHPQRKHLECIPLYAMTEAEAIAFFQQYKWRRPSNAEPELRHYGAGNGPGELVSISEEDAA